MSIAFACPRCGKRFQVDAARAGRRGRCPVCGGEFTVPAATAATMTTPAPRPAVVQPREGVYALEGGHDGGPSSYTPAPGDESEAPVPWEAPRRAERAARRVVPGQYVRWRGPLIGLAVAMGALAVAALLVPRLSSVLGTVMVAAGLPLTLGGYAVVVYIAFTEDCAHGFFCLVFAPYAAWYCVSRFDDLKAPLAAIVAGLALSLVGGWALEQGGDDPADGPTPSAITEEAARAARPPAVA